MKLVKSDGRTLEVRDCGPVIYRLVNAPGLPIPIVPAEVMEDANARALCQRIAAHGIYERTL